MTRALAHVEMVKSLSPIENADRIEVVTVLGWHCVTKKGDVAVGDLVVYFEIDSFLPIEPRYEFLRQSSFKKMDADDGDGNITTIEGFRLRTVKLRGQISQGLVLPLSDFPELKIDQDGTELDRIFEGIDVTDRLGIKLYEKPVPANMRGAIKGLFPSSIKKTDQERIQNHPEYFDLYRDVEFEVTEKIDGTSGTEFVDDDDTLNVCSRNLNLKEGGTIYWDVVKRSGIGDFLSSVGKRYAVQNEIAGEGINKNPLGIKGQCLFVFDIWDRDEQRHLTTSERFALLTPYFGGDSSILRHAPVISSSFKPFTEYSSMDDLIASANGKSLVNQSRQREGLVFKSCQLVDGQILSFKIVDNQLLLKEI
jgi:RNA ligase (TIGR02306 family)